MKRYHWKNKQASHSLGKNIYDTKLTKDTNIKHLKNFLESTIFFQKVEKKTGEILKHSTLQKKINGH